MTEETDGLCFDHIMCFPLCFTRLKYPLRLIKKKFDKFNGKYKAITVKGRDRQVKNKKDKFRGKYKAVKDKNYQRALKDDKGKYRAKE